MIHFCIKFKNTKPTVEEAILLRYQYFIEARSLSDKIWLSHAPADPKYLCLICD
jgi:hypothetical protein